MCLEKSCSFCKYLIMHLFRVHATKIMHKPAKFRITLIRSVDINNLRRIIKSSATKFVPIRIILFLYFTSNLLRPQAKHIFHACSRKNASNAARRMGLPYMKPWP